MCHTWTTLKNTNSVRISAVVICTYCEASSRLRRFMRSAMTPPTSENRMMGTCARKVSRPR